MMRILQLVVFMWIAFYATADHSDVISLAQVTTTISRSATRSIQGHRTCVVHATHGLFRILHCERIPLETMVEYRTYASGRKELCHLECSAVLQHLPVIRRSQ